MDGKFEENYKRISKISTSCNEYCDDFMGAVNPPTFETSIYRFKNYEACEEFTRGEKFRYAYSKNQNPTIDVLRNKLAAMEDGETAQCFSSGTAAIYTILTNFLQHEDHVVTVKYVYGRVRDFLNNTLKRYNISTTYVEGKNPEDFRKAIRSNTKIFYLESPSSWQFELQDLRAIAKIAKEKGIITIIDNTWATPVFQNPINLGIDVVIHSASKYLGGHSDLVAGVVVSNKKIIDNLPQLGAVLSPYEGNKLLRGLRTLPMRMERHQSNAMIVAKFLSDSGKMKELIYPGLKTFDQYDLVKKQMYGTNGLISFILDGGEKTLKTFMSNLKNISIAGSWGGFESVIFAVSPIYSEKELQKCGYKSLQVRLAVGIEDIDYIMSDIEKALNKI